MSEQNVEIVQAIFAAWKAREPEAALKYLDPSLEIDTAGLSFLGQEADSGSEGLQRTVAAWLDGFESLEWDPQNFIDAGDSVIVWLRATGRGRESKAPFEQRFAVVYTIRDGLLVGFRAFDTLSAAASSAGI